MPSRALPALSVRASAALALAASLLSTACSEAPSKPSPANAQAGASAPAAPTALPAGAVVTAAAASFPEAAALADVRASAKVGDRVIFRGVVGGREEPFVKERAIVLVADPRLKACNARGDDHCRTPWDFCCEDPDELRMKTATIQVVDASGRPLRVGLGGAPGLSPLAQVVVEGTVAERDDAGTFVVNATRITIRGG